MLLKKYADENRLRNVRFYMDYGYSGSNFDRPDFKRIMNNVDNGKNFYRNRQGYVKVWHDHILVGY